MLLLRCRILEFWRSVSWSGNDWVSISIEFFDSAVKVNVLSVGIRVRLWF